MLNERKREREYREIRLEFDPSYKELQKVEHYYIRRIHHTVIASIIENTLANATKHFWRKEGTDEYRIGLFPIFTNGLTKLCIEISDNGEGIDRRYEDDYSQIFEPRISGDRHTTGVGLGLWLVKEYIDEMGGTIDVKSVHRDTNENTSGTTISIQLPITDVIEKKKIIILEDNPKTRASMIDWLNPYYSVTTVESEEEFHEIFKPEEFDAVACDYYLWDPEPSGANIIKEISEKGFKKTMILYSRYEISADGRTKVDKIATIIEKPESDEQILYTLLEEFYEREF